MSTIGDFKDGLTLSAAFSAAVFGQLLHLLGVTLVIFHPVVLASLVGLCGVLIRVWGDFRLRRPSAREETLAHEVTQLRARVRELEAQGGIDA